MEAIIETWLVELKKSAEMPDCGDDGMTAWKITDLGRQARDRDRQRYSALQTLYDKGMYDNQWVTLGELRRRKHLERERDEWKAAADAAQARIAELERINARLKDTLDIGGYTDDDV